MRSKNINLLMILMILTGLFLTSTVIAQEEELIDRDMPESWYETPKLASELGINEFKQAPVFSDMVQNGELPPVEDRLPEDPPVIEPYGEIGKYGGEINTWDINLSGYELSYWNGRGGGIGTPDYNEVVPFYLEGWDYSNDYKELTIHLREGLKWSDGEPFTSEDYVYWWEHVANNEDLNPVPPEDWNPGILNVTTDGDYTIIFHLDRSAPRYYVEFKNHLGANWNIGPAHYMKDFHPDFVGEEKVKKMARDVELNSWDEYYWRIQSDSPVHPEYEYQRPVLTRYIAAERSETNLIMERNPYYPFVDTEGNQLPYIDKININLANNREMVSSKVATGDADFAARNVITRDIPLYKKNEQKENFTTLIYRRAYGSEVAIQPNLTHKNDKIREIMQNVKFRRALSLAIDRENINNKVYYGQAVPMQATVPPINKEFKEKYARAYAEYDPDRAKKLLDEIGMVDIDGDGYRETPDGEEFNPQLIFTEIGPVSPDALLELVRSDWDNIGIEVNLKYLSRELINQRDVSGDFDFSVWTVDAITGISSGNEWHMAKTFAPSDGAPHTPWPEWMSWYKTDGEEGMEPPSEIKALNEALITAAYTADEEERLNALDVLLEAQAENIWSIGTVGMGPQPIIVSNKIKNVPQTGIWDAMPRYMIPYRTAQFYIEE